jgi:DNA invertase Pin-like site-specific DNA recombinase
LELGCTDTIIISDDNLSTSVPMEDRHGLNRMLAMLDKKTIVLVYSIDRLARDDIELPTIRRAIQTRGAKLISCNEGTDEIVLDIMGVMAKHEKKRIIQRTVDALRDKQRRMERVGRTWFGYRLDETKLQLANDKARSYKKPYQLIPDEREYPIFRMVVNMHSQGIGYTKICQYLNENGHTNRDGKIFHKTSVCRMIYRQRKHNLLPMAQG